MFRFFLFFITIFFILNTNSIHSQANINKTFTNIVIHQSPRDLPILEIENIKSQKIILEKLSSKVTLINFWATWCAPCKEEMPSLDRLQVNQNLSNLKIFAINISQESKKKVDSFFEDLNIKNFDPYFDAPTTLAKTFTLRGVPTSILIDKNGKEFARIMGSIDFNDQIFINWLKTYN